MKNNKKTIIIVVAILCVILISSVVFIGYNKYQEQENLKRQEELIATNIENINDLYNSFLQTADYNEKLEIIKSAINKHEEYLSSENVYTEVTEQWNSTLSKMKENFYEYYTEMIVNNTIDNLAEITDKTTIQNSVNELTNLKETIVLDGNITCENKKQDELNTTIDTIISSYNERLEEIIAEEERLAQEEAERKAEEERLAKEQAEKDKQKENNTSNSNKNENNQSNNGNNNNSNENNNLNADNNNNGGNNTASGDPHSKKYSSFEEVERLIQQGAITDWESWTSDDGFKWYNVGYWSYGNDGSIIDLRDPVYGHEWE